MDFDSKQSRNLLLAGTVAFPTPLPTTGTISFEVGQFTYVRGQPPQPKDVVLVQEYQGNRIIVRVMFEDDVAAVFVPGSWDVNGNFHISRAAEVCDFERGEWFLDTDVNAATIQARLHLQQNDDIKTRNSILRGIVFIGEDRPVLRITETFHTAGADEDLIERICCTCHWGDEDFIFPTAATDEEVRTYCTRCLLDEDE